MRDFAIPAVITALSLASSVMAQSKVEQSEGAMALEKIRRVPDLNQKSFAGQNGRSIDCPVDGRVYEILNLNLADEIGSEFALMLYPPPNVAFAGEFQIFAILDFSDGGVAFSPTRFANFISGVVIDWLGGAVIPIPAGRVRVSAWITQAGVAAGSTIRLGASLSKNPHPRTFPLTLSQYGGALPPGIPIAFVLPGFASRLRIESSQFATRTFRIEILSPSGLLMAERIVAPGIMMEPLLIPGNAWTWRVTNLGLVAITQFSPIWELSL